MPFINYTAREINFMIAYYGPGLAGKTTNMQYIYSKAYPNAPMIKPPEMLESAPHLAFAFSPRNLAEIIPGFAVRLCLRTNPGIIHYDTPRKLFLRGADGLVFVADSQRSQEAVNRESLDSLRTELLELNKPVESLPHALQFNKRDLATAMPLEEMRRALNTTGTPEFEAIAREGIGVFETLKAVVSKIIGEFKRELIDRSRGKGATEPTS